MKKSGKKISKKKILTYINSSNPWLGKNGEVQSLANQMPKDETGKKSIRQNDIKKKNHN
jgi:hypothetical protein